MPFSYCISSFQHTSYKNFKIEQPDLLFLVVFYLLHQQKYHFSQIFRTSFNIISKKDFCHEFSFLTDSLKTPHPLNGQNLLSVTKFCCRCSPKIYNKQKILYVETAKVNSKDVKGSNFVHSEEFPSIFKF